MQSSQSVNAIDARNVFVAKGKRYDVRHRRVEGERLPMWMEEPYVSSTWKNETSIKIKKLFPSLHHTKALFDHADERVRGAGTRGIA